MAASAQESETAAGEDAGVEVVVAVYSREPCVPELLGLLQEQDRQVRPGRRSVCAIEWQAHGVGTAHHAFLDYMVRHWRGPRQRGETAGEGAWAPGDADATASTSFLSDADYVDQELEAHVQRVATRRAVAAVGATSRDTPTAPQAPAPFARVGPAGWSAHASEEEDVGCLAHGPPCEMALDALCSALDTRCNLLRLAFPGPDAKNQVQQVCMAEAASEASNFRASHRAMAGMLHLLASCHPLPPPDNVRGVGAGWQQRCGAGGAEACARSSTEGGQRGFDEAETAVRAMPFPFANPFALGRAWSILLRAGACAYASAAAAAVSGPEADQSAPSAGPGTAVHANVTANCAAPAHELGRGHSEDYSKLLLHYFDGLVSARWSARLHAGDFVLPSRSLKVYIYPLPASMHGKRVRAMTDAMRLGGSACSYGLGTCHLDRPFHGLSLLEDFSAEAVILAKFLAAADRGALTDDADQADIFLVPWLSAAESCAARRADCDGDAAGTARELATGQLLSHLADARKAVRHVFLHTCVLHLTASTRPEQDACPLVNGSCTGHSGHQPEMHQALATLFPHTRWEEGSEGKPVRITLGPRKEGDERHVVVPGALLNHDLHKALALSRRAVAAPGTPPPRAASDAVDQPLRDITVFLCAGRRAAHTYPAAALRNDMVRRVHQLQREWPASTVRIVETPSTDVSARHVSALMRRSVFCVCPPGDMEYTTRFLEAIANGCLPVVVQYPQSSSTAPADTWHLPGSAAFYNALPFAAPPRTHSPQEEVREEVGKEVRGDLGGGGGWEAAAAAASPPRESDDGGSSDGSSSAGDRDKERGGSGGGGNLRIPYEEMVVALTAEEAASAVALRHRLSAEIDSDGVSRRQAALERVRSRLVYDFSGESEDAFSALLEELVSIVSSLRDAEGSA